MTLPYIIIKAAASLDGYIDDKSTSRRVFSNAEDLAEVQALRASVDAILVGAGTLRRDNPRLIVDGENPQPRKVCLSRSGAIDLSSNFFQSGIGEKLLYVPQEIAAKSQAEFSSLATVIGTNGELSEVLSDLYQRGIKRLLIEGGANIHDQFFSQGLFDEFRLIVAPCFLGESGTARPRFPISELTLVESRALGSLQLLRYKQPESL